MNIFKCPTCKKNNRIEKFKSSKIPVCGKCGSRLFIPATRRKEKFNTASSFEKNIRYVLIGIVTFFIITIGLGFLSPRSVVVTNETIKRLEVNKECIKEEIYTGVHINNSIEEQVAPLKIVTPRKINFYIKLLNSMTKSVVMTIYIKGGETIDINVPLGSYDIVYAYADGDMPWCGDKEKFGRATQYVKALSTFDFFTPFGSSSVKGYKIELIEQVGGNLPKKNISGSEFNAGKVYDFNRSILDQ